MKKSFTIFFFFFFLLLSCSISSKLLNSKIKYQEFNKINSKNKEEIEYSSFDTNLSADNNISLTILNSNNVIKVGEKGIIYFLTDYNDTKRNIFNLSDIEERSKFNTKIKDDNQTEYNVSCRLWKPINDYIRIICKMDEKLEKVDNNIILLNPVQIEYKNYNIEINQKTYVQVKQFDYSIPFLYSSNQNIEIKDYINSYILKFKYESYNNEVVFIYSQSYNYAILDNCKINGNELNCEISKKKLEEVLIMGNEIFKVKVIHDNIGIIQMDFAMNIENNP